MGYLHICRPASERMGHRRLDSSLPQQELFRLFVSTQRAPVSLYCPHELAHISRDASDALAAFPRLGEDRRVSSERGSGGIVPRRQNLHRLQREPVLEFVVSTRAAYV